MMLGARTSAWAKSGYTAKDYNYDLALWDAIENAGYGVHNASATSIINLLGGGLDIALFGNYTVNANNIRFDGGYGIADKHDFTGVTGATISVLASYDSTTALNAQGWSYAGSKVGRLSAYYDKTNWFLSATSAYNPPGISSPISTGTITKTDFVWDVPSKIVSLFVDGIFVGNNGSYNFTMSEMVNRFRMMAYGSNSDTNNTTYNGNIYNCAVSTRALTADEIAHNYAIDKVRFGIGGEA